MELKTLLKSVAIMVCVLFLSPWSVSAQFKSSAEKVLKNISRQEDRGNIEKRYHQFIKSYSNHAFDEIYELLSNNFLKGTQFNSQEDFVSFKKSYYADSRTRFVSFVTSEIAEATDNNSWIFRGCLTEIVGGKKNRLKSTLYVWRERGTYLFSDISPVVLSSSGKTEKCK